MTEKKEQTLKIDRSVFISMMAEAYGKGLQAGQRTPSMKDDPEFAMAAIRLFSDGLADMMGDPAGKMKIGRAHV